MNLRYVQPSVQKPHLICIPLDESHVQTAVLCAKHVGLQLRVRSGGHDSEGVSYASELGDPFVLLDMSKLRSIIFDTDDETAWVEAGATLGELYYQISQQSETHAFPAGEFPTVGVGGHITGGGDGILMRKYGLAADNVVDVRVVDPNGKILDKEAMGEDLFWALRGGGGGSFGIILAWKIKLVPVPQTVTTFTVAHSSLESGFTNLLYRWQQVAHKLDENVFISAMIRPSNSTQKSVQGLFKAMYLGNASQLLDIMGRSFPELGLEMKDCNQMRWIEAVLYIADYPGGTNPDVLLQGKPLLRDYFKWKSDYVRKPIPAPALDGLWKKLRETDGMNLVWFPYGGMLGRIPEDQTPYPHRKGTMYKIEYVATWHDGGEASDSKHIGWSRELYAYMEAYVSKSPREAYVNYRDLDLGMNKDGNTSVSEASAWGLKYFKNNFQRLVQIKTKFDRDDFFRHEQSIPPLSFSSTKNTS